MSVVVESVVYEAGQTVEGLAGVRGIIDDGTLTVVWRGSSHEVLEHLKNLEAETKRFAEVEVKATFCGARLGDVAARIVQGAS